MRILVHEHASGGGLIGREVPPSLGREGSAMLGALVHDLAAVNGHEVVTTVDPRFPLAAPSSVELVTLPPNRVRARASLDRLIMAADAVWLIAPETGRCLERLASKVERARRRLLGPGADAIRNAADKAALPQLLERLGLSHPRTQLVPPRRSTPRAERVAARDIGFPLVVKPSLGAGCEGVRFVRDERFLQDAVRSARMIAGGGPVLVQEYVRGVAVSVALLLTGGRTVPLALNFQSVRASSPFVYRGGRTPFEHALAARAVDAAVRVCRALPGLCGYVGVDLVLTRSEAVVIEVNPRLTTAYIGIRAALGANVAELALAACQGVLTERPAFRRTVRFTAAGEVRS